MKTSWLIFTIATLLPAEAAADNWWQMIQRAGEACFSGRKFKVEIVAGAAVRTLGDRAKTGPFTELRLTVPLWDQKARQQSKREEGEFLEHAADILRQLNEAKALMHVKSQHAKVLQESLLQDGQNGISSFFEIQAQIAILKTTKETAERKLEGFVTACEVDK